MANLLLAQSTARQRELAIRLSLGASRWLVARQLLIESLLLSFLGSAAGVAARRLGQPRARATDLDAHRRRHARPRARLARARLHDAASAWSTGLLFGVAPALRATGAHAGVALRDHSRGVVAGGTRINVGHGLVALQVAVSFVLVLGASLFVRTLVDLTSQNMGFDADRVLIATVDLRRTGLDRQAAPGALRAPARGGRAGARRRGGGRLGGHADEQQRVEQPDHGARLRRTRARSHRALQSRDAGLLPGDGHADPGRPRHQRLRSPRRAEGRPRQRNVREEVLQGPESARQDVHDRHRVGPTRTTLRDRRPGRPTRSTSACAKPPPPTMYTAWAQAGDGVVGRARQPARAWARQRVSRHGAAGHPERAQGSGGRLQGIRRGRPRGGDSGAARRARCRPSLAGWRCCSRRSASTASCRTRWHGAATRSAFAWRSARHPARSCAWSCRTSRW